MDTQPKVQRKNVAECRVLQSTESESDTGINCSATLKDIVFGIIVFVLQIALFYHVY